jgi:hypothetical protein
MNSKKPKLDSDKKRFDDALVRLLSTPPKPKPRKPPAKKVPKNRP